MKNRNSIYKNLQGVSMGIMAACLALTACDKDKEFTPAMPEAKLINSITFDVSPPKNPEAAVAPFVEAAKTARKLGIGLNAGHDLSLVNLNYFYKNIPWVDEVSIGHALISDALYLGLERTIQEYKNCLR